MDRDDLESGDWMYQSQSRVQALLRGNNGEATLCNARATVPEWLRFDPSA